MFSIIYTGVFDFILSILAKPCESVSGVDPSPEKWFRYVLISMSHWRIVSSKHGPSVFMLDKITCVQVYYSSTVFFGYQINLICIIDPVFWLIENKHRKLFDIIGERCKMRLWYLTDICWLVFFFYFRTSYCDIMLHCSPLF